MDTWNSSADTKAFNTTGTGSVVESGLLTEYSYNIAYNYVLLPVRSIVCVLGIFTNSLCIRAFYRTGSNDSVTMVLFFQAVVDFCFLVSVFTYPILAIASLIQTEFNLWYIVDLVQLRSIIVVFTQMILSPSGMITAFLAVQRFLCVALPLHFKGLFTRKRTIIILLSIFLLHVPFYVALLSMHEFRKVVVPPRNQTLYVVAYKPDFAATSSALFSVFGVVLTPANQITITFCVIFMTNTLVKSVRFRLKTSSQGPTDMQAEVAENSMDSKHVAKRTNRTEHSDGPSSTYALRDTKELLVIKQVVLVCTLFLICNTPRLIFSYAVIIEPEFNFGMRYSRLFRLTHVIRSAFEYLNSSLNFFVYYKYNDKFRNACFRIKGK